MNNNREEIFVPVSMDMGISLRYEIGDHGTIRNTLINKVLDTSMVNGRPHVQLRLAGSTRYRKFAVNQLVALHFIEKEYDELRGIIHKDGDVNNLHYKNLEWTFTNYNTVSGSDRKIDLTVYQVKSICEQLEEGAMYVDICADLDLKYDKYMRNILSKIKCGELFVFISQDFDIDQETRKNKKYNDSTLKDICESISKGERKVDIARRILNDPYADSQSKEMNVILSTISKIQSRVLHTGISMNYEW